MDAYGNLTDISEFTHGRRFRLISYMNPDVAAGGFGDTSDFSLTAQFWMAVHRLSAGGDPAATIFVADQWDPGNFTLTWAGVPTWWGQTNPVYLDGTGGLPDHNNAAALNRIPTASVPRANPLSQLEPTPHWTVDFVYDCWFAFNRMDKQVVLDVCESDQTEGNAIIWFPWNNGANQIWRAATRGPGL
jgi:hypothetical protein